MEKETSESSDVVETDPNGFKTDEASAMRQTLLLSHDLIQQDLMLRLLEPVKTG